MPAIPRAGMQIVKWRRSGFAIEADADSTIFEPRRVLDNMTYDKPLPSSEGIPYVLVNGVVVVRMGELGENAYAGKVAWAPVVQQHAGKLTKARAG